MKRLATEDAKKTNEAAVPLGRYGSVKEIADATIYIFSDSGNYVNASTVVGTYLPCSVLAWLSDQRLIVDGGAWRLQAAGISGSGFSYPDFILSGMEVTGVSGQKQKAKI